MAILLIILFPLFLFAQQKEENISVSLKKIFSSVSEKQQKYWQYKFLIDTPLNNQIQKENDVWNVIKDWATGEEKQRKIQALSDYLFNMYVATTAQGYIPPILDFKFAGVLDPLENLPTRYKVSELLSLYYAEQDAVKKILSYRFKNIFNIEYDIYSLANADQERKFLRVLSESYRLGERVGYQGVKPEFLQIQDQLKKEIADSFQNCMTGGSVCTYERVDMMNMMDRKRGTAKKEYYYRPTEAECDASSYMFCKGICKNTKKQYDGWQIKGVWRLRAKPIHAGDTLSSADGTFFVSASGEKYPAWDYHVASVLSLQKGEEQILLVEDPFLFEEPVPLSVWAGKFHRAKTIFFLTPFQRKETIEKQLFEVTPDQRDKIQKQQPIFVDGKEYLPAPVRKVE